MPTTSSPANIRPPVPLRRLVCLLGLSGVVAPGLLAQKPAEATATASTDRVAALRAQMQDYTAKKEALSAAAVALQSRAEKPTPADWKALFALRGPMMSTQTKLWNDYLEGPRDQTGLEVLLFLGKQAQQDKALVRDEALAHYADHDAVAELARFPISASQYSTADDEFLQTLAGRSASATVRATAMLTRAEGLHELGHYLADLRRFDSSVEEAVIDMLERAMRGVQETFGGKKAESETKEGEKERESAALEAALREKAPTMPLYAWKDHDPDALIATADQLLSKLEAEHADTPAIRVSFTATGMQVDTSASIGAEAATLAAKLRASLIGKSAPVLTAVDYDGHRVDLKDLRGKVVLLDFWATWCNPCRAAMPGNDTMAASFAGRPFALVTLSVDAEVAQARKFMAEHAYRFTNWYLGPGHEALTTWQVEGYPTYVVIDDLGVVQSVPRVDHEALVRHLTLLIEAAEGRSQHTPR